MTTTYMTFEHIESKKIDTLNTIVHHFRHKVTGADHFHLESDNDENVFLVGFRTVPEDSTGVAHILEHTSLCGSKRYPVRDPFFMMLRRSLNTFMNAFTSSDWTAYPFASQNKKDFDNLLSVYLDAVFFPRLDPLDFAQEGHRIEFETADDSNSDLVYKGVVFNEMKGAMSSTSSQLWQALTSELYPTNTYHYNSGGEPEDIPDLTHEQLVEFHRTHYHPSNATFVTFGNIDAAELQEQFEKQALHEFKQLDETIEVSLETRFKDTQRIEKPYPFDEEDTQDKTHIVMGWLLGENIDAMNMLEGHFLAGVLLDNSASPLRAALEQTDLAKSTSPMCGLEDSNREMCFLCGVEGSEANRADDVERLIISTLEEVAEHGIPLEQQEAILHQLEIEQREVGGAGYPYGLQLILQMLPSCIHRGKPLEILDIDDKLTALRSSIQDPNYVKQLVKKNFLDNPHRVRLSLLPDTELSKQKQEQEKAALAHIKAQLTEEDKAQVIQLAADLEARQEQKDDPNILPKVTPADIPAYKPLQTGQTLQETINTDYFAAGTNGLVYQTFIAKIPELSAEERALLPLYVCLLDEVGAGSEDYLQLQLQQSQYTGSVSAGTIWHGAIDELQRVYADFTLSGKALSRNHGKLTELMLKMLLDARFDEKKRICEVVEQIKASAERRITGNGHTLAMMAACSKMSPLAAIAHSESGLQSIDKIRGWAREFDSQYSSMQSVFAQLQQKLNSHGFDVLLVGEESQQPGYLKTLKDHHAKLQAQQALSPFSADTIREQVREVWTTTTQVNFCAKAFPTVPSTHPDAARLTILASFLRNGSLHTLIREKGGAYGGGASHDSEIGAFRFYSYRDPRHLGTLEDFDRSLDWLHSEKHSQESLDEAILSVIAGMDKPSSPAGEARKAYYQNRYGRTDAHRKAYREGLLNTTLDDLKRVAQTYLDPNHASIAVITNPDELEHLKSLDLNHIAL